MIEIGINSVVKNFGFKNVLNGVDFEIMTGDRVAIVGRNGTGKSTIFKIIAGEENADKGTVSIRKGAVVGFLEQIPKLFEKETSTRQVLEEPFALLTQVERKLHGLETAMTQETDQHKLQKLMDDYELVQNQFIALDGYAMEENFNRITNGFGLIDLLDRPFNVLSGGQKTIVKLACTILKQPDILLLDEPTNHLDVKTLEWFEGFLAKYNGTVVIISHDRYFLDKVVTKTILLDEGTCNTFNGNYSFSLKEQERLLLLEFAQYKNQQKKIDAMQAAIKRFRDWGNQGDNEKFFKKAKELEKKLEKIEIIDKPKLEKSKIPLSFSGDRSSREVLKIDEFSLTLGELTIFNNAQLTVFEKEKVCLMGDNGTGKTTLIKAVLGELGEYEGEISITPRANVGYIPQEIRFDCDSDSVLEAFCKEYICTQGEARGILAKFFFYGENVFKRVSSLSGGEKVLLKLAVLIQNQVNFLVLDEPTNHIDIETREMLEEALLDFKGTILFVSHDRYFINKIANRITEINNREISSFYGDYDSYKNFLAGNR